MQKIHTYETNRFFAKANHWMFTLSACLLIFQTEVLIGQVLQNGEEVNGSIDPGGAATFDFEVGVAGTIRVGVGETTPNLGAEPVIEVFDSGNQLIAMAAAASNGSDASVQFQASEPGEFSIVISDLNDNESMDFRLRAVAFPDGIELLPGRDKFLENGEETLSALPLGSFSLFPFDVESAGTVRVSIGETGANLEAEPFLQIFDSFGVLVGEDSGNENAEVQFTTFVTGTFFAMVTDITDNESLEFRIRALAIPSQPEFIAGRDAELANGEEFEASLPIGGFAVYTILVPEAGNLRVSVGETGENTGQPFLQVFSPSGELLADDDSANDAFAQFVTFDTGIYTILVADNFNNEPLDFRIRAVSLPATPILSDQDALLQNETPVFSAIEIGDFALFRFDLNVAGTVTVSVSETGLGQPARPFLRIMDPSGLVIGDDSDSDAASVQFTSFQTGTYTAIVFENANDQALEFSIVASGITETNNSGPGDLNGDGEVDLLDVSPFIDAITSGDFIAAADINADGEVNLLDVDPFVALLSG